MEILVNKGVTALYRHRLFIGAVTLLAGVTVGILSLMFPSYEAHTVLVVTHLGATGESATLLGPAYPAKVYSTLLLSPTVLGQTIDQLVKQGVFDEGGAPDVTDFSKSLSVSIETVDATTRPVTYSPLIRLSATSGSPDEAAAIVRAWSDVVVQAANRILTLPIEAAATTLGAQSDKAKKRLDEIANQLAEDKSKFNTELMAVQAEFLLKQIDLLEAERAKTARALQGYTKSIETIRQILAQEQPFVELARAPSEIAFWMSESGDNPKSMKDLSSKVMVSQELNRVYWDNKAQETTLLSSKATAEATLAELESTVKSLREQYSTLQSDLGIHTVKQRQLETQEAVAKSVYEDLAKAQAFNSATLGLVRAPTEDGPQPVGLNPLGDSVYPVKTRSLLQGRNAVVVGAILGLLLSACAVIIRDVGFPFLRWAAEKYGSA